MTQLVGILNITPNSFSDGGFWDTPERAERKVAELFEEGADIVDIGAESTKPGAREVGIEQEWSRLEPLIQRLQDHYDPSRFSIDTRHGEIARRVVGAWSDQLTINDVSTLHDPLMVETVATHGLRVVVSHLPRVANGNIADAHKIKMHHEGQVMAELSDRVEELNEAGIKKSQMILDPGIGFGKSAELNARLVSFAEHTKMPVMIGYSRKRFVAHEFHRFATAPNVALGRIAVASGAAFLRVHDVVPHKTMIVEELSTGLDPSTID